MTVIIMRIILAVILCYIAGSRLGELTSGLSLESRFRVRIIGILLIGTGLLLPTP